MMNMCRTFSATICTTSSSGLSFDTISDSTATTTWVQHTYSFNASASTSTVVFVVATNNKWTWILDDISVTDSTSSQLLINGDFESGSLSNGWVSYTCGGTVCVSLAPAVPCHGGSGSCYSVPCNHNQFLQQAFATVAGQTYNFSFWIELYHQGPGNGASYSISFNII